MANNRTIPIWVYIYAAISLLSSLIGVYGGYIDGTGFYSEFSPELWQLPIVNHLAGMWASKNLAIIIVMGLALINKNARWLIAIFLFRFISDTIDILYLNTTFRLDAAAAWLPNIISWLILGLPSALAAWHLHQKQVAQAAATPKTSNYQNKTSFTVQKQI